MIIGILLLIGIIIGVLALQGSTNKITSPTTRNSTGDFTIWIVGDSSTKFTEFLASFKEENKGMSQVNYVVESFDDYEQYSQSLTSAFIQGKAPDMFVLNNNESSIFQSRILPIPNDIINITQFRKDYKTIFNTDLIVEELGQTEEGESISGLIGMPAGYETLGIFYNRRFKFKGPDFNSIASMNTAITGVKELDVIPMAIGNGSTIVDSSDLLSQFFLLNKVTSLEQATDTKVKQTLGEYTAFGSVDGINAYNTLYDLSQATGKDNIDLFANNEVGAIVGYPRTVKRLEALGVSKTTIYATPFPHYFSGDGPTLANYNYFVINADTQQSEIGYAFMQYLATDEGTLAYLNKYPYYLSPRINIEADLIENKVSNYLTNIVLGDFYSDEPLSSFNKGTKVLFDTGIQYVLDDFSSYMSQFEKLRTQTLCQTDKMINLTDLGVSCK